MQDFLAKNAKVMGIELNDNQIYRLLHYSKLIEQWNKVYNLTAIKGLEDILIQHIFDSLSIIQFLDSKKHILDIGTGAGLPSVVIAIMTDNYVYALDKVGKKTKFVQFVKAELGLNNLEVINDRVENIELKFDIITSRAFSNTDNTIKLGSRMLKDSGKFLLMKGNNYQKEGINNDKIKHVQYHKVEVSQLSKDRYILEIKPKGGVL